jgi:uncharacterized integral membrane protein
MRVVQGFFFLAFLITVGVFAAQNTGILKVNFLTWNVAQPVALIFLVVYVMGMLSGWAVFAFMRGSIHKVTEHSRH